MHSSKASGFSLIEMIIVIVIIGILGAIVTTNVTKIRVDARDKERVADIETLARQLEEWYRNDGQGRYPATVELSDPAWRKVNLKGLDPDSVKAPGSTSDNSIVEANNTVWNPAKDVIPLPTATTYVYQPRTIADGLCKTAGEKCVNFHLFYLEESTGEIKRQSSLYQ